MMASKAESAIESDSRNACNDEGVSRSEVPTAEVNSPLPCNEANQFLAKVIEDKIESDQAVAKTSEAVSFPYCSKLSESESLKPVELIPCDNRNYSTANSNINEDLRYPSPKQRRLEKLDVEDNDDCKRCNCNKTKCLNLIGYCDCFSAGKYCAENCSCHECFNRPEYENVVIDSRQLIEFWDPHAFDPKIIRHETETSTKRSMDGIVSSSARLKRGCNSTKSRCLKEYCESYLVEFLQDKGSNRNIDEELQQSSPTELDAEDNVDCKHCKCKMFGCKFACDCFAAGVDCTEACACQECFNRPESDYITNIARQEIELRNACAPKIIQHVHGQFLPDTEPARPTHCSTLHETETSETSTVGLLEDKGFNNNISGDLQQSSPKQKRLEELDVEDKEDSRRCHCKKNQCWTSNCFCFASGVHCDEGCACQDCFNIPQNGDTITDTTQQIESLNPQEFPLKFIQHATEASTKRSTQDGIFSSSSMHKKRCKCNLSRCSNNSCGCHKVNSGCSYTCECKGCRNVHGRKGDLPELKRRKKWSHFGGYLLQSIPKLSRLEKLDVVDNEECKRCNCMESKCLKLDCDCFASGVPCAEACACQECFNRPEDGDKTTDTTQQLESSNPHEFAQEIVQQATGASTKKRTQGRICSSSSMHKTRCNCYLSRCSNRSCGCFKVGVGCSNTCGCYRCENKHGQHSQKKALTQSDLKKMRE